MNPGIGRRYKRLVIFILVLAVPVGVLLFFYRMYNDDIKAIKDFVAAYERFDRAVSDLDSGGASDLERDTDGAVEDLGARSALRLSSLIKNDAGLMAQALEIVGLSRRETESLRISKSAIQGQEADVAERGEDRRILREKRKAAFARFQELAGTH